MSRNAPDGVLKGMNLLRWLAIGGVTLLVGCTSSTATTTETAVTRSISLTDSGTQISELANSGWTSLTLNLTLGDTAKDVYLAFTNTSTSSKTAPSVSSNSTALSISADTAESDTTSDSPPMFLHDLPFRDKLPVMTRSASALSQSRSLALSADTATSSTTASSTYSVGSTKTFKYYTYDEAYPTKTMQLLAQVTNSTQNRIINVWADSSLVSSTWTNGSTVTTAMAEALAEQFMADSSTGDDVYSWDTGVFGREYYEPGASVASDLVTPTGEIDIVLADLNPNRAQQSSYVLGYFWSANDYKSYVVSGTEYSNARISFYMDLPVFSTGASSSSWTLSDDDPSEIVSTLAHEFQHMIHYYQKTLAQGLDDTTDTWIDEMCAMEAEDLVADKLLVPGPRGVPLNSDGTFDYSTGKLATNSTSNRIGYFNRIYPNYGLATWDSNVANYSMAYSFGSWLARNYGGPALFRAIVHNSSTNSSAVVNAVNSVNGTSLSLADLERKWAASLVASTSGLTGKYNLQSGTDDDGFTFTQTSAVTGSSQTFDLGNIDYYHYYAYGTKTAGPVTSSVSTIPGTGLAITKALSSATGSQTLTVTVPSTVDVTVITKVSG